MFDRILLRIKKRWIFIVSILTILLIALFIYNTYISRKRYVEQAVMAQDHLEMGNFREAQDAFLKALSMSYGDKELLSIGLAEAYAGVHDYDKALEVLRSRYEVEKTTVVKEKIEEITNRKTDYRFFQLISYGDTYFSNGEYMKAIDEYEKAKMIKSREDTSYLKIVESYIAMERYDLVEKEVRDGLALAESDKLNSILNKVEFRLKEIKYEEILQMASEYIYQENYEEALNSFNEAIRLIPELDKAYNQMSELYITMKDYDSAKSILQNYLRSNRSQASEDLLNKVNDLISQRKEKNRVLDELYIALSVVDTETITSIMEDSFFLEKIAVNAPFFYSPSGNMNSSMSYGMLISNKDNIYAGGFRDSKREGMGIQLVLNLDVDTILYYYQGEWDQDIPTGMGKTGEMKYEKDKEGKWQIVTTETSGMFLYGLENGTMQKTIYADGIEKKVLYTAIKGEPKVYLNDKGEPIEAKSEDHYVIGQIYINNEPNEEYYEVKKDTKFSVKIK